MGTLQSLDTEQSLPPAWRDSPVGLLVAYHNLHRPFESYQQAQLLIGMCMDHRKHLHIPDNFAYIIRTGGGNLRYSEFKVSYAIGVGGVSAVALIGHTQCGMVCLAARKDLFVSGLVERGGWERQKAEEHFLNYAPLFEIGDETDFVLTESRRLGERYPRITVVPLIYRVEDNRLYWVRAGA